MDGGQWHERYAALGDLPHFTRLVEDEQQSAASSAHYSQLDAATDGLEDINIS